MSTLKQVQGSKTARVAERKRLRNRAVKSGVKTLIARLEEKIAAKDISAREETVAAISSIDRAVSKGVFHRNKAARLKSRLTRKLSPP
ncbi:MAG: 30S ribosomal protein S20 [Chloroflexi bacterium CG_4_9_14_3_um_filter_45_9]|nr:MAG: 30S ribosomal protein S20 [Dehalococcoidia bacterium CG2_30_46_9]PIU22717.1 MAG: 30S ribosomal protein S20 [Chloroflexi bacterium CG08_land_8_20_14_0_20_45_12]PIX27221.1 MAG: 30S ribosomal protein S20 [Chloroflexi bacterium CG_4_8_14_3_um_filter_45_15]PJB49592.1 MAG: 30S ribosomal protein S20 [Chloroflexi bacterium CG_4_9_14_3_um_filter_45_9]